MKKKILLTLMLVCMSMFAFGASVSAYKGTKYGDYLYYSRDSSGICITDCDPAATEIVIPSEIEGVHVYAILAGAFEGCTNLTSLTISGNIRFVQDYFRECTSLNTVIFENCGGTISNAQLGSFPDSVTNLIFKGSVPQMYKVLFSKAVIENVYITDIAVWCNANVAGGYNPLSNGARLYLNNELVTNLVIPDGVTKISGEVFKGYTNLKSVTISDSVTTIGSSAFSGCTGLKIVTIGDNVKSIEDSAFSGCTGLESITIGDNVTTIGSSAFSGCTGLKSVAIGKKVASIRSNAFNGCSIDKVYIEDVAGWCGINFSSQYENPISKGAKLYLNDEAVTDLVIPSGVTSIGNYAFIGYGSLASVSIPDSVTSIGYKAFSDCTGLKKVCITDPAKWCEISFDDKTSNPLYYAKKLYINNELANELVIPSGVTTVKNYAFLSCNSLKNVTIPNSVTAIEGEAFYGCIRLESLTIGNEVVSIGDRAFYNCGKLKNVTIPNKVTSIGNYAFYSCTDIADVNLGSSVETIGDYAFYNCVSLRGVTIPNSVTTIGMWAFCKCTGVTSITIPNSVNSIGNGAFYNCNLESIVFENGITSIPGYSFKFSGAHYVIIPKSVGEIKEYAFDGCSDISYVIYEGDENEWNDVYIEPNNNGLLTATKLYNAEKKTYKFETNCDSTLPDVDDYAIFEAPSVQNAGKQIVGWYDNAALSGSPVSFPYYGSAEKLYAKWENIGYTKTSVQTMQGGIKLFVVTPTDLPTGARISLALYSGDELVDVQSAENTGSALYFMSTVPYTSAKVMVWDSLSGMSPVCDAEIVK